MPRLKESTFKRLQKSPNGWMMDKLEDGRFAFCDGCVLLLFSPLQLPRNFDLIPPFRTEDFSNKHFKKQSWMRLIDEWGDLDDDDLIPLTRVILGKGYKVILTGGTRRFIPFQLNTPARQVRLFQEHYIRATDQLGLEIVGEIRMRENSPAVLSASDEGLGEGCFGGVILPLADSEDQPTMKEFKRLGKMLPNSKQFAT